MGELELDQESKSFNVLVWVDTDCWLNRSVAIQALRQTGEFEDMTIDQDEDEHSIEMHLPFVRKIFEKYDPSPPFPSSPIDIGR